MKENIVIANHAFMGNAESLLKSAYLLHQLLCAVKLPNVITGPSKDNELKKKKAKQLRQAGFPGCPWSCVICPNERSFGLSKALLTLQ